MGPPYKLCRTPGHLQARAEAIDAWWDGVVAEPVGRKLDEEPFFIDNLRPTSVGAHRQRVGGGGGSGTYVGRKRYNICSSGRGGGGSGLGAQAEGLPDDGEYGGNEFSNGETDEMEDDAEDWVMPNCGVGGGDGGGDADYCTEEGCEADQMENAGKGITDEEMDAAAVTEADAAVAEAMPVDQYDKRLEGREEVRDLRICLNPSRDTVPRLKPTS